MMLMPLKDCAKLMRHSASFLSRQYCNVQISSGFQKGKTSGNREKREQKKSVYPQIRRRIKQECATRIEQQAGQNATLVAKLAHENTRRNGHHKIAKVESGIHDARLPTFQIEGKLKVADEGAVQAIGDAPEEKKAANQRERHQVGIAAGSRIGYRHAGKCFVRPQD